LPEGKRSEPAEPLVSIIMPAWNAADYLQESVGSVLAQTYANWELLIVDDGSTDGTRAFLDGLVDPRIRIFHQENRGVSAARNVALDEARGELITFLDADDALPERSLEIRVTHMLDNPDIDILDGVVTVNDRTLGRELRRRVPGEDGPFFPRLIRLNPDVFFGPFYMMRREAVGNCRFEPGLTHCEDLLFFLQAADVGSLRYGSVREDVYSYRVTSASAMSNLAGLERGYLKLYERAQDLTQASMEEREYLYRRIRRILVRSWLRRFRPDRALWAWLSLRARRRVVEVARAAPACS
jgi:teichuronic acid biosynthesis glycosyltransferase TuaG